MEVHARDFWSGCRPASNLCRGRVARLLSLVFAHILFGNAALAATPEPAVSWRGYAVQLGAFRDRGNAESLQARLQSRYPAVRLVSVIDHDGRVLHRVLTGRYPDPRHATRVAAAIRADGQAAVSIAVTEASEAVAKTSPAVTTDAYAPEQEFGDTEVAYDAEAARSDAAKQPPVSRNEPAELVAADAAIDPDDRVEQAAKSGQRDAVIAIRPDDIRPPDQFKVDVAGRPLTTGGEYGITPAFEHDHRLRKDADDDRVMLDQELQLEFLYPYSEKTLLFAEAKLRHELDQNIESGDDNDAFAVERGETWVFIKDFPAEALSVQIGRQNFTERRQWWWDKDLDGVRLYYDRQPVMIEAAIAEDLARLSTRRDLDPEDDDVLRGLLRGRWDYADDHRAEFFFVHQIDHSDRPALGSVIADDEDDVRDGDLDWIGARASGKWKWKPMGKFRYWLDYGYVRGEETQFEFDDAGPDTVIVDGLERRDVSGHGVDVGLIWQPKLAAEPSLTLGYAYGSGDADSDGTDNSFRQTGIQRNNGKFRGVNRFRYYGELLRPELSNLRIWTVAGGMPVLRSSSVELLYHYYQQVEAANFLRDSGIRADPLGIDRAIGHELDFVIGLQEDDHLEVEFVTAMFLSGEAFGALRDRFAADVYLKANYNF
jgi:alginate production protein